MTFIYKNNKVGLRVNIYIVKLKHYSNLITLIYDTDEIQFINIIVLDYRVVLLNTIQEFFRVTRRVVPKIKMHLVSIIIYKTVYFMEDS